MYQKEKRERMRIVGGKMSITERQKAERQGRKNGKKFYDMNQQAFDNNESWSFKSQSKPG